MRKSVLQNGIVVKAYAGTTGVLLAFNLHDDKDRENLLGFATQLRLHLQLNGERNQRRLFFDHADEIRQDQ